MLVLTSHTRLTALLMLISEMPTEQPQQGWNATAMPSTLPTGEPTMEPILNADGPCVTAGMESVSLQRHTSDQVCQLCLRDDGDLETCHAINATLSEAHQNCFLHVCALDCEYELVRVVDSESLSGDLVEECKCPLYECDGDLGLSTTQEIGTDSVGFISVGWPAVMLAVFYFC